MGTDAAELSSIQAGLEELQRRMAGIAERRDADPDDPVAPALFEVDRSLRTALRQLEHLRRRL